MGKNSAIPWTHHTFNPWWGCSKVSPGCDNCYAKAIDHRFCSGGSHWGVFPRRFFGPKHWQEPLKWDRAAKKACERHRVLCGSMCDVFQADPRGDDNSMALAQSMLFKRIHETQNLDWLLLTKRPENIERLWNDTGWSMDDGWRNVWLGVTAENQAMADERIPILLDTPAVKRFVSIEPLLGPVNLAWEGWQAALDWVIVGDESGPKRRPAQLNWVRSIRDQCVDAGVPFFFKQWHGHRFQFEKDLTSGQSVDEVFGPIIKIECPSLDGRQWVEFPK